MNLEFLDSLVILALLGILLSLEVIHFPLKCKVDLMKNQDLGRKLD